jgi:hypothetical protein
MKRRKIPFLRRLLRQERGQSAAVIAGVLAGVMALSAAGVETGHVYYAYRVLLASTNAAVLAAGQAMPNIGQSTDTVSSGSAWGYLNGYSSTSGAYNANSLLSNVKISTATFSCSSTATSMNVFCEENTGTGSSCTTSPGCNVITATQTAKVNLWFGGLVGLGSMTISATSEAAMAGGHPPYNIAVIIDTTASMKDAALSNDDCPSTANTQIGCAVYGLEQMLIELHPCWSAGTCTSTSEEADGVALFVFPSIEYTSSTNYTSDDTVCNTSDPPIEPYGFENLASNTTPSSDTLTEPTPTSTNTYLVGSTKAGATYQVTGFNTAYKSTDGSSTLSTTNPLAVAAGGSGSSNCKGLGAPGGEGTYYAQAIMAAQAALVAQQSYMTTTYSQPTTNIMIILSDGDANACNTQADTASGAGGNTSCNNGSQIVSLNCPSVTSTTNRGVTTVSCGSTSISQNGSSTTLNCPSAGCSGVPLNGTGNSTTNPAGGTANTTSCYGYNCPAYPSALGECGQAVWAAQQATAAGTIVYTVAMGAETPASSGNCGTDLNGFTLTGLSNGATVWPTGVGNGAQTSLPAGSPCNAISAMASTASTFYSDDQSGACASTVNGAFESMASIFTDVAKHLSTSRLIPVGSP